MKTYIEKLQQVAVMTGITLAGIGSSGAMTPANALTFNFTAGTGVIVGSQVYQGFTDAGAIWSSLFTNDVTLNFTINYQDRDIGASTLGYANTTNPVYNYNIVANALASHRNPLSADDTAAVNSLSSGSNFNILINQTIDRPSGSASATPYVDNDGGANNRRVAMTNANAKVLGLIPDGTEDANIVFNSAFNWDFDFSDGITPGTFDFVGVAAHEIGHALGFISGVDGLDDANGAIAENGTFLRTLDLFRYSALSNDITLNTSRTIDFTADERDKYFSLDGGLTKIASFARGVNFGRDTCTPGGTLLCPRQASHWSDNLDIGIMDPTTAAGEILTVSENDLRAFDVIGWNRATVATAVPEPADFIGTAIGAVFGFKLIQKRRQQRAKSTTKTI
ncbi:NF038122 family metalloprotease [Chamaesiphon sp. OTE_20_metabat_361]|uniref:NF038122 family metalloprotease n=1 Tax=Chamaesiphon sp. OTE_20_metabat_361 TaxID=2964689 RepID=UPI00286D3718|nr:NF038122 family metalloprotease [Chamaesiphon sp. OTE_20_metabat_361]